jgi:hypothetical protein
MNQINSSPRDPWAGDLRVRSNFVRRVVQRSGELSRVPAEYLIKPQRRIVQYWDNLDKLPPDVGECMDSWKVLEEQGFELLVFDANSAQEFIRRYLGPRYNKAFEKCYHPAMQSDYFRLCYIFMQGGFYVDADDVYSGADIEYLFCDGRLKVQPLCYDIGVDEMILPSVFANSGENPSNLLFYFANTPLIAVRSHPILKRALESATTSLERAPKNELPEIQSTTGPGNLTKSIFEAVVNDLSLEESLFIVHDWADIAITKWPLSYRSDMRNWRLSNQRVCRDQESKNAI